MFVDVDGKGVHGLTSGHGLQEGQQVMCRNWTRPFGTVVAVVSSDDHDEGTCDAALVKLDGGFRTTVRVNEQAERCLSANIQTPRCKLQIQKFCDNPEALQGSVKYEDYTSITSSSARCFAAVTASTSPEEVSLHEEGESGIIVTTSPSDQDAHEQLVSPVGTLVSLEFLQRTDDGRGDSLSLGVPLERTLRILSDHPYCGGRRLRVVGVEHGEGVSC